MSKHNNPIKGMVAGAKLANEAAKFRGKQLTVGKALKGMTRGIAHPNKTTSNLQRFKDVKAIPQEVARRLADPKVQANLKALRDMNKK